MHAPKLRIVWEKPLELPVFEIPKEARVFARERWQDAPLMAGFRRGAGAVLWVAAPLGPHGYERFPYISQALADLGLDPPFRSDRLWAFFDSSYRSRVDLDYFAARWRAAGISALHVAAWHYWERDPQADEYLRQLIEACHRHAISVYAWLELPHVSEKFWDEHPEWREKTALLQDAQLDWRKLMNLTNRDGVRRGVRRRARSGRAIRLGWRESGRAVFRIARGYENPGAVHAHERRCPGGVPQKRRVRSGGACSTRDRRITIRKTPPASGDFSNFAPSWPAASRPNGSRRSRRSAKPSRIWIWR